MTQFCGLFVRDIIDLLYALGLSGSFALIAYHNHLFSSGYRAIVRLRQRTEALVIMSQVIFSDKHIRSSVIEQGGCAF